MDFYEEYYRKNGLLEKLTKEAINISKYHKSKKYQTLSSKEKEAVDKEEEELNKAIKSQITFYPYRGETEKIEIEYASKINDLLQKIRNLNK